MKIKCIINRLGRIKGILFYFFLFSPSFLQHSFAQTIKVVAKTDSNNYLIGDHIYLNIELEHSATTNVTWPQQVDSINQLEVINRTKIDTVFQKEKSIIRKKQTLTLTAFDSGYYIVPPFIFFYKEENDTTLFSSETEALLLTVQSIPIDTTSAIKDIKSPLELPFTLKEALPYILGGLLIIAIAFVIFYFIKTRKKTTQVLPLGPPRPAHEIALERLKEIEGEKLWQQGKLKLYYSKVSEIIRTYIEQRYNIKALELTTHEIIRSLNTIAISQEALEKLNHLLRLADLVKFAKAQPLPSENELSIKNAYGFIECTMPQPVIESYNNEIKNE